MKVVIDWGLCDGNGICAVESPEVFEIDDEDNLIVLQEQIPERLVQSVESAIASCPKQAISLRD